MTITKNANAAPDEGKQHWPVSSKPKKPFGAAALWLIVLIGALVLGTLGTVSQWQSPELVSAVEAIVSTCLALAIVATFAYLVSQRWNGKPQYPSSFLAWCWLVASLAACTVGFALNQPAVTSIAAVAVFGCCLHAHQTFDRSGSLIYFVPPLLAFCCLPTAVRQVVERETGRLLSLAITPALDWLQIPFQQLPAAIQLSNGTLELGQFFVAPTTSLLGVCALLIVAWYRRPLASIPFYLASALMWAFGVTIVKVAYVASCMQSRSASILDWQFGLLSLVCFVVAVALLFSTDRLLRVLLFQIPDHEKNLIHNPVHSIWNRIFRQMAVSGSVLAASPVERGGDRRQRS